MFNSPNTPEFNPAELVIAILKKKLESNSIMMILN